ncbi:nucleotide sugar dehydrogenase [Methanoregula formicica SMSP]|uniref:UDP-N-acetyl-D-mannosamine dehydrogenase n=2 Tax=Methanoregula formicica TaxID=882104 RepID=L0HBV4_METFS|nr:nucleotide sugar dehydrogenase [Methanoregula formicica SMSP]
MHFSNDICIIGGAGHVGLPLGITFANIGKRVVLYDVNSKVIESIRQGNMPFIEYDAEPILKKVINKTLFLTSDINQIKTAQYIIVAIGTPVDEYLNPKLKALIDLFIQMRPYISPEQTIIIRSTVYPRTCGQILNTLSKDASGPWHIAYCPERIIQGYAIRELRELPQLVAGLSDKALNDASQLFGQISPKIIQVSIEEAELAKLFTNAWRYIQFAMANQFYMISAGFDVDFNKVRRAIVDGYGRAYGLPSAGFAAGPCLLKDTLQLAAFNNNNFLLGHAAMTVNEGLPGFIVEQLRAKYDLSKKKVGILGMTFKADIDDTRDSLSYKLGKILRFYGAEVLYSDEFAKDPTFINKEELVRSSDIIIVGVPHTAYKTLKVPKSAEVVDLWRILPEGH